MSAMAVSCGRSFDKNTNLAQATKPMITIDKTVFGRIDGKEIFLYTLASDKMTVRITILNFIANQLLVRL